MRYVSGSRSELPAAEIRKLGAYRFAVFVERLGWELDTPHGDEKDQFDRDDTVYVMSTNESEEIFGCARLLPTTQPYLLSEVFPELLNGFAPPASTDVWELSRFAAMDLNGPIGPAPSQISSPVAIELLRASIQAACQRGAKHLITVSPIGIERLLRHAGFQARRAGPPKRIGGFPLVACIIDLA